MNLTDIVTFWASQSRNSRGEWMHPEDAAAFAANPHTFNLDFPVSPYVGNVLGAPIVILGANAGYKHDETAAEFPDELAVGDYLARVRNPGGSDWSSVAAYYSRTNYGDLIAAGRAVLVNACAYRSPKITKEPDNKRLIEKLVSVQMTRRWLVEAILPLAVAGERLVIAKRPGLWSLSAVARSAKGVVVDRAPVSPRITSTAWEAVKAFQRRWE